MEAPEVGRYGTDLNKLSGQLASGVEMNRLSTTCLTLPLFGIFRRTTIHQYLEDLIVTEKWRGKGIGKLLFDRVVQETKELGFSGMVWQVLDWNQPAIDFYKKYEAGIEAGWLNASLSKQQVHQS